ncbi:ATP-binding cassette domain-containing protein [Sorangium sp. So ce136]|uniref:ATP-binding cassette domain-containing protein n=1 Tax=Sorangium sp. So ce136 TaxID=3133284 RepID=UPI003F0E2CB8
MDTVERVVARGVVKTYGTTAALRGVNATIEAGRLTLIEGANGSGKSTLLGILGTVVRPTSGTVLYEPFGEDTGLARGTIGWLSHESLAYPDLSGRQNVELAARFHGLDAQEAWRRAEERFELGSFALRPLRTCSRGQRQRIALARALVHHPSLVLLDEPTTGLDRSGVARLLTVVEAEVARGAAVVVVSHEPEVFRARAAARLVLERGRVVTDAS